MKKSLCLLLTITTFIIGISNIYAAGVDEVTSVASGSASTATYWGKNTDEIGATIESNTNIDGIKITLTDKDGKMLSNKAFTAFYKNDRHAKNNRSFYNKKWSSSNKASVMTSSDSYEWKELTSNYTDNSLNVKFKLNNVEKCKYLVLFVSGSLL